MSRVGKKPVELGKDLTAEVQGQSVTIKGKKGSLTLAVNSEIEVKVDGNLVKVAPRSGAASTQIRPPYFETIELTIDSPRPVPWGL